MLYHHSVRNTCASLPYRFVWNILRACSSPCSSLCKAHMHCGINHIHQRNLPTENCWEWGDTLWLSQWEIHFEEEICGQSLRLFAKPKNLPLTDTRFIQITQHRSVSPWTLCPENTTYAPTCLMHLFLHPGSNLQYCCFHTFAAISAIWSDKSGLAALAPPMS